MACLIAIHINKDIYVINTHYIFRIVSKLEVKRIVYLSAILYPTIEHIAR